MGRPLAISSHDILSAARREFAEHGYGNTSLRQLLSAAEVSTTAFYSRYPSKEAVLIALVEGVMQELFAGGQQALARVTGVEDGIAVGVEVLVTTLSRHRVIVRLALTEGAAITEVRDAVGDALATLAALLASHIAASRRSRRASRDDRDRAWALVGALHMQVMRWIVFGQTGDDELGPALISVARSLLADPSMASATRTRNKR